MFFNSKIFSALIIALLGFSCSSSHSPNATASRSLDKYITIPYDLQNPNKRIVLPTDLVEVSGLTYLGDDRLGMIQDERGKVYVFDLGEEEVVLENKFWDKGDYEGIEYVNGVMYAIQSDGDVFKIKDYTEDDPDADKDETPLRSKNNTEGLGYDPVTNSLLIACKSSPHLEDAPSLKGSRAVYAYDLDKKKLDKEPFLLISLDSLRTALDEGPISAFSRKIINSLGDDITFKPSCIAVHPITGHIWLISSIGKMLVVTDRLGNILNVSRLGPSLFNHPEGICFSPGGTLFVSNEGDEGVATLLIFRSFK